MQSYMKKKALDMFTKQSIAAEKLLQQQSKVDWISHGDSNTAYFHAILKQMRHKGRITSIIDDEGNIASVTTQQDCLTRFAATSGLEVNTLKSAIYTAGVSEEVEKEILQLTGFVKGSFSMRYLGLPLSPTKWSKIHCQSLIDKISAIIKCWSIRHLSYARRTQLVNSVLFFLQVYRASTFILPQHIVKRVEQICRDFLWGQDQHKIPLVSRDRVCLPKTFGGFDIKRCKNWNSATIGKHVWAMASNKILYGSNGFMGFI